MNILAIFLLFSCATVFGAQPEITADYMVEGNFHNVAIYMGFASGREDGAVTRQFAHALCQKEFPIIAGNGVFKNLLRRLSTNFLYYVSCYGGDANLMLP
ncbi:MAG TPA: hypothetical protein VFF04_04025 [Candidatus Babeliales bacterium]|nr:hypothetical protein [Candidatus Babeliales bacterium]